MNNGHAGAKDLILGAVRGYTFDQLKPFILSLKKSGFQGDVCFFIAGVGSSTIEALRREGIQVQPYKEFCLKLPFNKILYPYDHRLYPLHRLYPYIVDALTLFSKSEKRLARCDVSQNLLGVWCSRYLKYYVYLLKCGKAYANIMLTDVRDVVFQRDPFDFEYGDGLNCFLEDGRYTIGSCPINSDLIIKAFGRQALAEIGDQRISCSGITIGTYPRMMRYLETMVDYLTQLKQQIGGIDQGIHNYIICKGLVEKVKLFDNSQGPVFTMGTAEKIQFNDDGFVVNQDGNVINVLHQYDRHPSVQNKILAQLT